LRRLSKADALEALNDRLRGVRRAGWHVSTTGHTLTTVRGPVEFQIGSPDDEHRRDGGEDRAARRIPYSYEIATHEVTVGQFLKFFPEHRYAGDVSPTEDCPMNYVSWYE
jgi:formylglycine-generating enzyme required for sulfatase activity